MRHHHIARARCAGQAVIEFCIGLIVILLLVTGLIHVHKMAAVSLAIHGEIRAEAGEMAMRSNLGVAPDPVSDWEAGADGVRHTADDRARVNAMSAMGILETVVRHSARSDEDWQVLADKTQRPVSMAQLQHQMGLPVFLGCVYETDTIPIKIDPFLRRLVLGAEEVKIKEEVWMPQMGGLY